MRRYDLIWSFTSFIYHAYAVSFAHRSWIVHAPLIFVHLMCTDTETSTYIPFRTMHCARYFLQRSVILKTRGVFCSVGSWTWAGRSWMPLAWQSTRTLESCTWPISRTRADSRAEVQIIRVASSEPTWMEVKPRRRMDSSLVIVFGCRGSERIDWFPFGTWVVSWLLWSYVNYARF